MGIFGGVSLSLPGICLNLSSIYFLCYSYWRYIKVIIDAVINILPNISNVMSLFVLALFIYSCVGISLFAGVKIRDDGFLDSKNNF